MSEDEAVLLLVHTGQARQPGTAVAALADVPVAALAAALAELVTGSSGGTWVLAPLDGAQTWPAQESLRGLGVLDGTRVVLRPASPFEVSGARS